MPRGERSAHGGFGIVALTGFFPPLFFFYPREKGIVIICMEIDSILEILKLYLEKLAFSSPLSFLSSRKG